MSDPSLALQGAIVAALTGDSPAPSGGRVYDEPPAHPTFPYVVVGDGQNVDRSVLDCYDATESFLQIDVWSRAKGYPEVKGIASVIRSRLHDADLTLSGHTLELMRVQSIDYSRDPDGMTRRARILVRALTQPAD